MSDGHNTKVGVFIDANEIFSLFPWLLLKLFARLRETTIRKLKLQDKIRRTRNFELTANATQVSRTEGSWDACDAYLLSITSRNHDTTLTLVH